MTVLHLDSHLWPQRVFGLSSHLVFSDFLQSQVSIRQDVPHHTIECIPGSIREIMVMGILVRKNLLVEEEAILQMCGCLQ